MKKKKNSYYDFLKNGKFNCTKCGACCSFMTPLVEKGKFDPKLVDPNGRCKNMMQIADHHYCVIYETRPDICRIENTLSPFYSDREIAKMCKVLKDHKDVMDRPKK